MANRTEEFLNLYRVLEEALDRKYEDDERRRSSVVMEFMDDAESRPYREMLDLCREIRNLLTHHAALAGEAAVEPAEAVLAGLREIIAYVKRPPLAMEIATPAEQMAMATLNQPALEIMRMMENRGFSHIPVVGRGALIGVFSRSTVFSYLLDKGEGVLGAGLTLRDFREYLPIDRHSGERFLFMDKDTAFMDAKEAFEDKRDRKRKLAMIFLTESGAAGEPILGVLTPWDVLGRRIKFLEEKR